jgi:DNA polymerase III alpha subunit (gram-positive type)
MVQGHGCIVDVLRPQSTDDGMTKHCGQQYGADIVMQNHSIFDSCPWHLPAKLVMQHLNVTHTVYHLIPYFILQHPVALNHYCL